jgi:hypothetical protein
VPMHTATRLAVAALPAVRELNSSASLFYGAAPVNESYARIGCGDDSWRESRKDCVHLRRAGRRERGGGEMDSANPSARYPGLR